MPDHYFSQPPRTAFPLNKAAHPLQSFCKAFRCIGAGLALALFTSLFLGCNPPPSAETAEIIGQRGVDDGHFSKPRAIEINAADEIHVIDMTGRIQVLTSRGEFIRAWRTPEIANGKPCGLGFANDGLLMVADTHYFRVLFYRPDGTLVPERTIGGTNGRGPGQFGFVTDAVQDASGNYYVSEYGDFDRIQKFDSSGNYICEWGGHGTEPGQFLRPQALAVDEAGQLWVADACNHRLQVFDLSSTPPRLVKIIGSEGTAAGQLRYPYGIWLGPDKTFLVTEFGNHRIQKMTRDGQSLATFGSAGRGPGQFHQPWSLVCDSSGAVIALDSYNHRLQRFQMPADAAKSERP
jgi:DNA-binding beta-propeller fold protein YncE